MEFGSLVFLLRFLPVFMICYVLAPGRMKNFILLLGSFCFYAWGRPLYLIPLVLTAISDFCHGFMIERYRSGKGAGVILTGAVLIDLSFLSFFGYSDFMIATINKITGSQFVGPEFVFPVGMAVYTLQSISYLAAVYKGKVKAIRSLPEYLMYVSCFLQLAGGPIVQYETMENQFFGRKLKLSSVSFGAKRACIGLAKKVLLADAAGELWMQISAMDWEAVSVGTAWLGAYAIAFQMYFTLSGYSDIARGLAACLGFEFPENFDHPFSAVSVTDFCRRWNLTLTKWYHDYVYTPLAGNNAGILRQFFCMTVMGGMMGLWYGADWTFLLWGIWLAFFLFLERIGLGKLLEKIPGGFGWVYTTLVAGIGWVLLAQDNLENACIYLYRMSGMDGAALLDRRFWYLGMGHLPLLTVALLSAIPLASGTIKQLGERKNGACIALYRLGEKVFPPVLLLLSLIFIVGRY